MTDKELTMKKLDSLFYDLRKEMDEVTEMSSEPIKDISEQLDWLLDEFSVSITKIEELRRVLRSLHLDGVE